MLLFASAAPAAAQMAWDTPRLVGPETPVGLGVYWMRAEALPGDGDAVMAVWTLPRTGSAVAVRGGVGEGVAGEISGFGGIELRAPLASHSDTQPLDMAWTAGAGVGIGEYLLVSVPVSIAAGRSWSSGSVWFAPHFSAGLALEYRYGESELTPDEEFEVQPTVGLGVDLAFDPSRRFVLSASVALGDRQAVAVGLAVTGGR